GRRGDLPAQAAAGRPRAGDRGRDHAQAADSEAPRILGDRHRAGAGGARDPCLAARMTVELTARFLEAAAAAIVLLGVWLAITRSLDTATWLLAIQSLLLGLAAVSIGTSRGSSELVVGGLLAIGIRAVVLPIVVRRLLHASPVRHERQPYLSRRASAL